MYGNRIRRRKYNQFLYCKFFQIVYGHCVLSKTNFHGNGVYEFFQFTLALMLKATTISK